MKKPGDKRELVVARWDNATLVAEVERPQDGAAAWVNYRLHLDVDGKRETLTLKREDALVLATHAVSELRGR